MTVNAAVLPEGVAQPPQARAQGVAISSAGVGDLATIARQQLPSAVPAPALVAAYNAAVQPQTKQPLRTNVALPSSTLAAQFIAQEVALSDADLAIFIPPTVTAPAAEPEQAPDDFLAQLRIARGDIAVKPEAAPTSKPTQPTSEMAAHTQAINVNQPQPQQLKPQHYGTGMAYVAAVLPDLLQQLIRKPAAPVVVTSRGVIAYQAAQARNAANRAPSTTAAS